MIALFCFYALSSKGASLSDCHKAITSKFVIEGLIKEVKEKSLKPRSWSGSLNNEPHFRNKTFFGTKGWESYHEALVREVRFLLGKKPNLVQIEAIKRANRIIKDKGKISWIREKMRVLEKAGFSKGDIHDLMENGIVWGSYYHIGNRKRELIWNLRKGNIGKEGLYFDGRMDEDGPRRVGRVNKILKETDDNFLVEVDLLDPLSGALKRDNISIEKRLSDYVQLHSKYKVLFEIAQSPGRVIISRDLYLPLPTNKEAKLAKQGFDPAFTEGFDSVNELSAVRRQLQELGANPYETHVQFLADIIEDAIEYVEKGLSSMKLGEKLKRWNKLRELKKRARKTIDKQRVTYKWFLEFILELPLIISKYYQPSIYHPSDKDLESLIIRFPLEMMIPIKGDLGFMIFNRLADEGVYPLGLLNKIFLDVDELKMSPADHMGHDVNHTSFHSYRKRLNSIGHYLFHKKIQENIEILPFEKRKKAEWVYFEMDHENEEGYHLFPGNEDLKEDVARKISFKISQKTRSFLRNN